MSSDPAIAREARKLLAEAATATEAHEAMKARCRAHELLVNAGFLGGRPRLRALFYQRFPPPEDSDDLRGWTDAPGPRCADLASDNLARRRRAARWFEERGRAELGMTSQLLLRDPRTVARLLGAAADRDPQVQELAIRALGHIVRRLDYRSAEVLEELLSLHRGSDVAAVRREIAIALVPFDDPRIWPPLVDALGERRLPELARRRLAMQVRTRPERMPPDLRRQVSGHLVALLRAERKLDLRTYLWKTIGDVGDAATVAELRALPLGGVRPAARAEAIAAIERRGATGRNPPTR